MCYHFRLLFQCCSHPRIGQGKNDYLTLQVRFAVDGHWPVWAVALTVSLCKTDTLSYIKLNYRQVLLSMLRTVI